ncbi:hypothetical protein Zmor_010394 [Zophobas morio]|uniref:Uncharacterized protein n=1 Tax=Zophobas morio TaxID=2755281 RepID=A0AA38INM8_9CUCU|nr:hypothetical protein Zmor_010394 [Zophobas morio]
MAIFERRRRRNGFTVVVISTDRCRVAWQRRSYYHGLKRASRRRPWPSAIQALDAIPNRRDLKAYARTILCKTLLFVKDGFGIAKC